ncbi:APC family permease [Solirubrobacter soli]|uniref:APC family permease n=1 Tax=Solirubrobacter soli TaxID=363832 RepID=UPI00055AA99C|nr:APC family permease [Solirubrobacter soli]
MRESQLTPTLTRRMLLLFIVGDILGGGIYARTGEVAGEIGGAIWTGFALAAVIAAFTAASYAELVAKFPQAAGAALYVHKAFKAPLLTFVVAFAVMCSGVSSAAALATAFGGDYLSEFVELPTVLVALAVIAVVSAINFRGIKESANFNLGCTLIELGGLFLVVLIGAAFLFDGGGDPSRAVEFKEDTTPALLIIAGASIAFYALIGFEDAVNVAEETKDATHAFPRTLFMGLGLAGAVYLLVTVIAGMAVPADTLAKSDGPLLEVVTQGPLSVNSQVFSAIALFAIVNGCLLNLVMASRLMYGMANEKVVPAILGKVHPGRRTPWVAIVFTASIAAVLAILGDLSTLADTTVLLLLLVFVGVHVALLALRRTPVDHDHFKAPTVLPWLGAATCAGLAIQQVADDPKLALWAGGLLAFGLLLWVIERAVR